MRIGSLALAALLCGCGGSTADTDAGARDGSVDGATPDDGGSDAAAEACPPGTPPIPDAASYACEAGAPDAGGCPAAPGDPNAANDPKRYPLGCAVTLPGTGGFCQGACCPPLECTCQTSPIGPVPAFICPL